MLQGRTSRLSEEGIWRREGGGGAEGGRGKEKERAALIRKLNLTITCTHDASNCFMTSHAASLWLLVIADTSLPMKVLAEAIFEFNLFYTQKVSNRILDRIYSYPHLTSLLEYCSTSSGQ